MTKFIAAILLLFSCLVFIDYLDEKKEADWTMSLALIIEAEGSNTSNEEKFLIGSVVLFRLYSPDFPKNLDSVIQKDRAFHGYLQEQYCYNRESYEIAEYLLKNRHEFMLISEGEKSDIIKTEKILYFWKKEQKKPRWVNGIVYKMPYHNFGI